MPGLCSGGVFRLCCCRRVCRARGRRHRPSPNSRRTASRSSVRRRSSTSAWACCRRASGQDFPQNWGGRRIRDGSIHGSLQSYCPVELTSDKEQVSSYDMNWISVFNVKLDLLGLRSVSIVDRVCRLIGIKVDDINFNDPFIYQQL
ncbi:MAG: hypothetical protein EBS39_07430, partial [Gammaproteobacteria bacterium]|nr:hypothetical protein [Gammaproteobacteria bacterium]